MFFSPCGGKAWAAAGFILPHPLRHVCRSEVKPKDKKYLQQSRSWAGLRCAAPC